MDGMKSRARYARRMAEREEGAGKLIDEILLENVLSEVEKYFET